MPKNDVAVCEKKTRSGTDLNQPRLVYYLFVLAIAAMGCISSTAAWAEDVVDISPLEGWSDVPPRAPEPPLYLSLISWLPNRMLDFWDIFKLDAGVGPALGGNIRITRYLQAGYREFAPGSLRVGALGRRLPVMWEASGEGGLAPFDYQASNQREVCTYELGVGLELLAGGLYLGVCPEQIIDFMAGIVFLDPEDDDSFEELF